MKKIICLFFLLITFPGNWLGAQSVKEDLEHIKAAYERLPNIQLQVDYLVYKDHQTTKVYERSRGEFKRSGNSFLLKVMEMLIIQNDKYHFMLSEEEKTILLQPAQALPPNPLNTNLDEALATCSKVVALTGKKGSRGYQFRFDRNLSSEMGRIDVFFDPSSYLVTEIVFYYRNGYNISEDLRQPDFVQPRLHVKYRQANNSGHLPAGAFSLSTFIRFGASSNQLTPAYQSYEFVDLTQKN